MTDILFVYITCSTEQEATLIAHNTVEIGLAACANIFPKMKSVYKWKGQIVADTECVLILKTIQESFKALEATILALHSYETPCVSAFSPIDGNSDYFDWISKHSREK